MPASVDTEQSLQISLLGEFSLHQGEKTLSLDTPSHQSLLAYLVICAQHVHSRQQLAFQFWPDSSESQARTNLRKALYTLRHTLPDADCFLIAGRQTIQWRLDAPCVVDAWDFESAVAHSLKTDSPADQQTYLEQAIAAYHGDFMPGLYDAWVLTTRDRFRQYYLTTLERLLLLQENHRRYPAAISLARKLLREDPLHEATYRRLMRLQSLDDNVAGALRTYHSCSTNLQRELGVNPSPATQETYERLLRVQAPATPLAPSRLPLVARKQAWQTLQITWQHCSNRQPGVVLLTGEAGIGKTRLAEEMLDWAEKQGMVVVEAACYPSEKQLAYAPVAKWLRSESLQPIFRRLDRRCLVECSRLLPELRDQHPDLPSPGPLTESWQRQHFFSILAGTLLRVRQPCLPFIDDLHWCDQDTLDWLLFLLQYRPQSRFLLLGAARSEEITPDHLLIPWQQQLDRDGRLTEIVLTSLDAGASARLAGHVLQKDLDGQQAAQLYAETEGNPLFVVEMARAGLPGQPLPLHLQRLPPKVQAVIETRLASLSQPAYELAQLAAVIGHSFNFDLLNHACAQGEDTVIRSLDELWQRRILCERGVEAYDFSHDKIRQVAYASLSQARRRQLHQRVWRALETLHAKNPAPVSGQIAGHCEAAGHYREAIAYYYRAAQVAQAVYANRDTLNFLQKAIALFPRADVNGQQKAQIYERMANILKVIGRYQEAEKAFETAVDLINDPMCQSRLYIGIAGARQVQQHYERAHLALNSAEELLEKSPRMPPEPWWHEWLNIRIKRLDLYYYKNRIEEMIPLGEEIHPIIEEYGSSKQHVYYYRSLTRLGFRQERYVLSEGTVAKARAAFAAAKDTQEIELLTLSCFALAFAYFWSGWKGDLEEAESHFQATLEMAEETGDVLVRTRCLSYLATLYRRAGNKEKVAEYIPKARAAAEEGSLKEYLSTAEANLAWLKWKEGDWATAEAHGQEAIALWQKGTFVFPFQWMALWPLIDIAITQDEIAKAVGYAEILLRPEMARLPEELISILRLAVTAYDNDEPETSRTCLRKSLHHARKLGQL